MAHNSNTNNRSLDVAGICSVCGKKSECKCDRCGDFYCSEDCQKKDWRNHRFICMPMPKLVNVGQSPSSQNSQSQLSAKDEKTPKICNRFPNGSCVILTGFKSSNRCCIRSSNPSVLEEHEKVLNTINEYGKVSVPLSETPKTNSFALTLKNGKWHRVEILGNSRDNCYRVYFVDSGEISKRAINKLHQIEPSISKLPCSVRKVQLKGVTISNSQSLMKLLVQYTNKDYKVEFVKADKSGGNVELFQWGSSILLNSIIQDMCSKNKGNDINDDISVASSSSNVEINQNGLSDTKDKEIKTSKDMNGVRNKTQTDLKVNGNTNKINRDSKSSAAERNASASNTNGLPAANPENKIKTSAPHQTQMDKPCLVPPFDIIPLSENAGSSKIMIMDRSYIESGYIGCLSDKYLENLKAISEFLAEYDVGDQPYKPKFNEYCLANFENEWYRAKVVEVLSENKFLVVYIDFTNEMEVSSESIRHYPMSLTMPCCTSLCVIDGLPEDISDEQKKFLELNCIPYKPLNIDCIRVKNNIRYVKSNELLNKMHESKLL